MNINFTTNTIELTKAEMREAAKYDSVMYNAVMAARRDNPGSRIVEFKAKRTKAAFASLDMKAIKAYVEKHGSDEQKATFAFITKRTVDADGEYCEAQSFFQIKAWFLAEFPEVKQSRKDYREKIQSIYDAAAAKQVA